VTRRGAYFSPKEWEGQELLTPEGYYQELKRVFSANLDRYFAGPHRYGISLTGGLDTRMIMAWKKFAQDSTPCYSFGSAYRDCEDVAIARRVARQCGQAHQILEVGSDYLSRFPHYAERAVFLSDGTTPVNRGSDLYVNEIAKQIAPVRITGNYGGEVLRQVRAFKPGRPRPGLLSGDLDRPIQAAEQTYQGLIDCHPLTFAVFRQATWHHYGLLGLEQTQVSMRTPYLDNDFVRTVFRAPHSSTQDNSVCLRLIADGDPAMAAIPTDRGLGGNSSALWTEMRHQILEFTFKAEYAYDYGMPQWVSGIDHALSFLHLERLFLGRHKFAHYRVWYRDQLAPYVREILLDSRSLGREHIQRSMVETIVRDHTRGNRNYTSEIHVLLTLEHICRLFLDRKV
jgi:asparagine synthase (glutamine-hydrolysing)